MLPSFYVEPPQQNHTIDSLLAPLQVETKSAKRGRDDIIVLVDEDEQWEAAIANSCSDIPPSQAQINLLKRFKIPDSLIANIKTMAEASQRIESVIAARRSSGHR